MKKTLIVIFCLIVVFSFSLEACSSNSSAYNGSGQPIVTSQAQVKTPTQVIVHRNSNLVNGIITVNAGQYYTVSFSINSGMRDASVQGTFTASGGSGNDIIVLILSDVAYTNWQNGHSTTSVYYSGQITTDRINVNISSPGTYYLVFSNTFSLVSSKKVNTTINLNWSEIQYQ